MTMRKRNEAGFTLVEMIVAVGLFGVVMIVAVTSLLSLIDANRKAQALQSVINNLNIAIDGMSRSIREGSNYRCNAPNGGDCTDGSATALYFEPYGGDRAVQSDDIVYSFHDKRIYKSTIGGTEIPITAPEVEINSMTFYVVGTARGGSDTQQPKVMMIIKGTAGAEKTKTRTTFHVQSTAVQRVLDI